MSTKSKVLEYFERHRGIEVSGQDLATELGLSRNAVWKAVVSLRECGYEIESGTNRGYRFSQDNDVLSEEGIRAALPERHAGIAIECFDEIDSTNNEAKRRIASGSDGVLLVAASAQTAGRGRRGRTFESPAGGLYLTLALSGSAGPEQALSVTMAAAVAACRAIERCCLESPGIKWVNDVYVGERKVCGILTEAVSDLETGTVANAVVGIGVNLDADALPASLSAKAGSVSLREGVDRNRLAAQIASGLIGLDPLGSDAESRRGIVEEYRARSIIVGRPIEYEDAGEMRPAVARAIGDDGSLEVELPSGEWKTLRGGEVTIRF